MNDQKPTTSLPKRIWRRLMAPVGPTVVKEGVKTTKSAPHGVALLIVLVGLALMSAVVTDLGANETIRYKLATHDRDVMRAQALAESGVNLGRLVLGVQGALQPMLTMLTQTVGIPLPAQTVWELLPMESALLRGMISGELQGSLGMDVSGALAERREAYLAQVEDAQNDPGRDAELEGSEPFVPPEGGFGGFDGDFSVEITDEERVAVSLRGWRSGTAPEKFAVGQKLFTLFQPERYDFLFEERDSNGNRVTRDELVANIFDWMDTNTEVTDAKAEPGIWGQQSSGIEDGLYFSYGNNIEPKNEYYDSHQELRMVHGMSDAHMKAFGDSISVYASPKVNILSAPPKTIETLIRSCAQDPNDRLLLDFQWMQQTLSGWSTCKRLGPLDPVMGCKADPDGFVAFLGSGKATPGTALLVDAARCKSTIGNESQNFRVKSTGTVNEVTRTVTMVVRVVEGIEERYYYSIVGE